MVDVFTLEKRKEIMRLIQGKNTKPELITRSILHRLGYRFRLHTKSLPGKPDIVLPKYKTVVFVHGCFWHQHKGCKFASIPSSNKAFWNEKFERNISRDAQNKRALKKLGWNVITVWGCSIKSSDKLAQKLESLLKKQKSQ